MTVLVIDNIDSFVYNLVQYVGICGEKPLVVRNNVGISGVSSLIDENNITHIIISPGPGKPSGAGVSGEVISCFGSRLPILGVCLGHQMIAEVYGGKVVRAEHILHGKTSSIAHQGQGLLEGLKTPFLAERYHSLIVSQEDFPACLRIDAKSMDDSEIMAISHRKSPVFGVQFHPESILTKEGLKLIENFLEV